jgi:signal transduction histidine kinase
MSKVAPGRVGQEGGTFSGFRGYAVAVVSVGIALILRLALDAYLGQVAAYSTFYIAVVLTVWLAGRGPAVLAIVLGVILGSWFFVPPRHSLVLRGLADYAAGGLFVLGSGVFVALIQTLRSLEEKELELKDLNVQLEIKVAERTAQLRETIAKLEHVSYSLSHDMRAPLRAMHSFAELLLADCGEQIGPEGKGYLGQIMNAAGRLDKMIQDTLNYSRIAGTAKMELQPVDIAALLHGMIESYPQWQAPGVEIHLQEGLPVVLGNEVLLTQCFSNLLNNALKFVSPGNVPRVSIREETKGSRVRFWVEDNGIGIPKEAQERIFEMFERAAPDHEGTGIGLAIVRKAVELMGGKVGVESEVGHGSKFWIELTKAHAHADSGDSLKAA